MGVGDRDRTTGGPDRLLGSREGSPRPSCERPRVANGRVEHVGRREDRLADPEAHGLGRRNVAARIHHLPGATRSRKLRQALRPTGSRDHADQDLGLADLGIVGQISKIRGEGELQAPAQRESVDRRDRDLGHRLEQIQRVRQCRHHRSDLGGPERRHLLHVGARREDLRAAPQNESPDVLSPSGFGERPTELESDGVADRVGRRPVDPHDPDPVVDIQVDELHAPILPDPREARPAPG